MNLPTSQEEFEQLLRSSPEMQRWLSRCLLCNTSPPSTVSCWIPNDETRKRFGEPKGKMRTVWYSLCEKCDADRENLMDKIEKILSDRMTVQ